MLSLGVCSWLVYTDPGFGGFVGVLEVGEYPCPEAWGFPEPFIGSLRPLRMVQDMKYGYMFALYRLFFFFYIYHGLTHVFLFITGSDKGGAS